MAGSIKGITIQIGADTTKLSNALNTANRSIKATQSELKSVEKALKLDPTNINLLKDKQQLLTDKVADTTTKLDALKQAQSQLDAQGVDKNSKEYQELQRNIDLCEAELKELNKETKAFGSAGAQAVAAVGEKFQAVGEKITAVGSELTTKVTLPLAAVGTAAVASFADVDKTMQLTNKTMGNTEEQAQMLEQAMKDAAANSTFGMSDAATATLNFARAGLDAEQAASALAPAMNLAAGEGGNLDVVSAGLVATINGFGDGFDKTSHYADVFASACNNSALDVDSLSESMSIAAPIFSAAGYSIEDATLYLGTMANAGIDANVAATSLKTGLARLASPTDDAAVCMEQLGLEIFNADGSMKDSVEVQKQLHDAFAGLSEQEQLAAASTIFGKNQMSSWLALINTAPADVQSLNDSIATCSGTTDEMADAMMSGFGGSLEKLKSSIDVAVTSLGSALAPTIQKVADAIQGAVDWFNSLSEEQQQMVAKIGLVVAAIGPLLMIVGKVVSVIGTIMTFAPAIVAAFTAVQTFITASMVPAIGGLIAAIAPILAAAAPFIAVGAAIVGAGVLVYKNWDTIKAKAAEMKEAVTEKISNMKKDVSEKWKSMKESIANSQIGQTVSNIWDAAKQNMQERLNNMKTAYDTHGGGLRGTVAATMQAIKDHYSGCFNAIDTLTGGKLSAIATKVNTKMTEVKGHFTNKMEEAKTNLANKLEVARTTFTSKLSAIASTTNTKMVEVKGHFTNKMEEAKTNLTNKLELVKSTFSSALGHISSTVTSKMAAIKKTFTDKIQEAHDAISGIIEKIKRLFDIQLKLDIKLPHVSVHGGEAPYGIGGKGSLPSFSVDWYDKGGIFDHPSIIGVGEKRPEFVGALDDLRAIVREESGFGSTNALLVQLVELMGDLVEQGGRPITVNQTINATETSYAGQQKSAAREFKNMARALT